MAPMWGRFFLSFPIDSSSSNAGTHIMSSFTPDDLDSFLSAVEPVSDFAGFDIDGTDDIDGNDPARVGWKEPGYEGTIDYRVRQLSYSSLLTLHSCPRKFQLYRLRTTHRSEEAIKSTVTFAFGHVVGEGIAAVFRGESDSAIIWNMFLGWDTDLAYVDEKLQKSIYTAIFAIQRLLAMRAAGFLADYELVYYNGQPATELSFSITFPDGFRLRGFVDAVIRHRVSGKVTVLECKTTGSVSLNPATYKNSAQAIGYSIVLDVIYPDLSSYEVMYLVYQTKSKEYTAIPFEKTYLQRAQWIRELLLDIETIKMYEEAEVYPMHGESCFVFFRECEYFNTCQLSTKTLTKPMTIEEVDTNDYEIVLSLNDLLETQLKKTSDETIST